ncbi:MAG: aminotransferase class III-fold pyridoxal phosphate-dependent enzyme, partial [Chloroflexota bacterium]|nr:aminotransferase class III-fold pyridoxal phosphate-dependent enzyme [Chloroflexota bacterium]
VYAYPGIATRIRGEVGEKLAGVAPGGLSKCFFTLGGADAIEHAMRMARLYTGREKIVTRYRSYHGATAGAASAGGDPRRLATEPGVPWIVRVHDPYRYRCLFCRDLPQCNLMCEEHIEQTIRFEGPENVAAVLLEGWSGSSGIIQPPRNREYFQRLRDFCSAYGILIIVDEVMSGFGRTGKWFGIEHAGIEPDIMAVAKGLTSGYLPLGATVVSERIADYFEENHLWSGLTYSGHPMCLAAASACIDVYREEKLIDNAARMGEVMERELAQLQVQHPSVGEYRGIGLFYVIDLVKNRETREPLSAWNQPLSEPMVRVKHHLRDNGLHTFVRWNWIFCVPPLIITEAQIQEGMNVISGALEIADKYYE